MNATVATRLTDVEAQLENMNQALLDGAGAAVEAAGTGLRNSIAAFADAARAAPGQLDNPTLRDRLLRANQALASQRENLARRAAGVDRALASLLPTEALPTYSASPRLAAYGGGNRFGSRSG